MADPTKTYDAGPCKNCGGTLRWRACGHCVECRRAYQRAHYEQNRQRKLEKVRAYYAKVGRERYYNLGHIAYYEKQLKGRRSAALKRMEARHGQIPS